ncbi:hypothetical protein M413DRAFT_271266 [Hebeloma cylindrosporum]|uniref:Uncharacterized protein n=1 Tax=Hebeloma cylindrosporum TaxID=76867 RepID=A0A0C2YBK5_HEBCY|nr:hypothetical protein M413DRAFT_271266 [Hebeloma cylindrosporum h7]
MRYAFITALTEQTAADVSRTITFDKVDPPSTIQSTSATGEFAPDRHKSSIRFLKISTLRRLIHNHTDHPSDVFTTATATATAWGGVVDYVRPLFFFLFLHTTL